MQTDRGAKISYKNGQILKKGFDIDLLPMNTILSAIFYLLLFENR
jgi:hypothetical protein